MKKKKLKTLAAIALSTCMLLNTFSVHSFAYETKESTAKYQSAFNSGELTGQSKILTASPTISPDINTKSNQVIKVIVQFKTTPIAVENSKDSKNKSFSSNAEAQVKAEHESFKDALTKSIINNSNTNPKNGIASNNSTANIANCPKAAASPTSSIKLQEEYYYAFNGIALTIPSNQVEALAKLPQVAKIWKDKEFQLPKESSQNPALNSKAASTSDEVTMDSFPLLGIDRLHDEGILGQGIKVGVLDTGIDYNHPDLKDAYKGGYDFVNNDNDPMETTYQDWKDAKWYPETENGETYYTYHGTHVCGTIAADAKNPGKLKAEGVAPDVNLYVYKVLGPYGSGDGSWILAGIDKAVEDKMDVINLSLGAAVDDPLYPTSIAINNAAQAGVIPVVAAGNSGPNDYTLGSPGTSPLAITVGASDTSTTIPTFTGSAAANSTINFKLFANNYDFDLSSLKGKSLEMVDCGIGNPEDFQGKDLTNKIALIQRGTLTFVDKIANAKAAGAKLVFIYNNVDGFINTYLDTSVSFIPTFNLTKADGETLANNINNNNMFTFKDISSEIQEGDKLADFSSRGPVASSEDIKPDVVAPGVNIFSTYPAFINDPVNDTDYTYAYNKISGTSMATPHVTGVIALMLGEAEKEGKALSVSDAKTILMNTSQNLKGDYSVYEEGSGRINAYNAVKDSVELKVMNISQTEDSNNNVIDIDNITGSLDFGNIYNENKDITKDKSITIVNNSKEDKKFNVSISHSSPTGLIIDSNKNGVKLNVPDQIEVPAGKTINVSASLLIPQNAAKGFYEGTLVISNPNNSEENYRIPYGVKYVDKGIKQFNLIKNAICDDYSNFNATFYPFTDFTISYNSPMVDAKLFIKDANTDKRIGFIAEYDVSKSMPDIQYQSMMAFGGYYQPMIGDYIENKSVLAAEGHYKLEIELTDKDGNKYSAEDHLFVDNTAPVLTYDKNPGIYSISDSDFTVENGIKAYYIHGKVHDDTIDKLLALGYKTDGMGNVLSQALNTIPYAQNLSNEYSGWPSGYLNIDQGGNFSMGLLPEELASGPQEIRLFPYDYSTATLNNNDQILFEFQKKGDPYGTVTYDNSKILLNDIFTSHINISNLQGVNKLNFAVGFDNAAYDIQSIQISDSFKKLLDSNGITSELSYEVTDDLWSWHKCCNISLELTGDTSKIDISALTSIIDIKAKYISEVPGLYTDSFYFLDNSANNYTGKDGTTSTLYVMCYDPLTVHPKTSQVFLNFTSAQGFFNDEGWNNPLPYDKLGIKVYVIGPDGKEYDGTVTNNGQTTINIPASLQDGMFYMEVPGHFKNWVKVTLGKSIDGEVYGIYTEANILTSYAGDINGDNIIDQTDLDLVTADLGKASKNPYLATDLNKDGIVDSKDLDFVKKNMGMVNPRLVEDAEEAIATLKVSQDSKDIPNAQAKVNALPDSAKKQELLASLKQLTDAIKLTEDINSATKAVEKAEKSLLQADVNAAMALVKALPESATKSSLLERLNKVQSTINAVALSDALKAVEKAEKSLAQADHNSAMTLVNALPASDTKNSLLVRLTNVQKVIDAAAAVAKAEQSKNKADIDAAKSLVNALPDGSNKTDLLNRLNKLPKTGSPIDFDGMLALGGLLSASGFTLFRKKKHN